MYNIICFDKLDSTNRYAKENISVLMDRDVIFTKVQTHGRGRMDRTWVADENTLTFSIVYKEQFILDNFSTLSILSSVAVYNTLSKYLDNVSIKWPNDVYCKDKKIVGILLESRSSDKLDALILGIGINVNTESFDSSLNATSMYLESNKKYEIKDILNEVISEIERLIIEVKNSNMSYLDTFRSNNYLKGKEVYACINNKQEPVKVIDILPTNEIQVLFNNELIALNTGEITFHKEK